MTTRTATPTATPTTARPPLGVPSRLFALSALPLVIVIVGVIAVGSSSYRSIDQNFPGYPTALTSGLLQLVVAVASTFCLGWWVLVLCIKPRRGRGRMAIGGKRELVPALWAALIWGIASLALVAVDSADAAGEPLSFLDRAGAFGYLIEANYLPRAWIVTTVCAFVIAGITLVAIAWDLIAVVAVLGFVGVLAPVVVTQVLVGPNHDFGGDSAIIGTPAFTLFAGVVITTVCRGRILLAQPVAARRLRTVALVSGLVVLATDLVVAWFELAGKAPWSCSTGWLFIAKDVLVIAAMVLVCRGRGIRGRVPAYSAALMLIAALALDVVRQRIPSPQYFTPTTIAENFFGFNVTRNPTFWTLVTAWRLNILFAVISAVGIGLYLWGVVRMHRRGDRWPLGRTIAWVLGWIVIFVCTSSGLGRYAGASFDVHMAFHMAVNMLGPLLLVLGGAMTLALRATTAHGPNDAAGPHEWVTALLKSRVMRWMYNPLEVFVFFIGSYYALYFTPLFEDSLRFHWAHQLAYVHFVMIGYLFYGLAIGVDPPPRPLPYLGKLAMILAAMPFHAFFGVIVMTRSGVIAQTFYNYLNEPWMTDLSWNQYVGGGIAWAAGEFPLVIVILALVVQWARQDARQARRVDRHLDSGADASYDAYNEMLARLGAGAGRTARDDD